MGLSEVFMHAVKRGENGIIVAGSIKADMAYIKCD